MKERIERYKEGGRQRYGVNECVGDMIKRVPEREKD